MITNNAPLAYAVRNNGTIHLFLLIYSSSTRPVFPTSGLPSGKKMFFVITTTGTGTERHFFNYSFPEGNLTDIEVVCTDEKTTFQHFRKIELIDVETNDIPKAPNNIPYTYTQKVVNDDDHFRAEIVYISKPSIKLRCNHSGPGSGNTNTFSIIIPDNTSNKTELEESAVFNVKDFFSDLTDGGHIVEFTGNPRSKGKTKNRNHSPTPFPGHLKKKS